MLIHCLHDAGQLGSVPVMAGIDHRIFQGREILKHDSRGSEVLAGNNDFFHATLPINAQNGFLCRNPHAVENVTADIFRDTAIGIVQVLVLRRFARKFQHILLVPINHSSLHTIGPCVTLVAGREIRKINQISSLFSCKDTFHSDTTPIPKM